MSNTLAIAIFILAMAMIGVMVISVSIYQITVMIIEKGNEKRTNELGRGRKVTTKRGRRTNPNK